MGVVGKHLRSDLYGVSEEKLWDEDLLVSVIKKATELANATLISIKSWRVDEDKDKGGVSVLALVNESHISIHTWPNYRFATLDIYTCGEHTDPMKAFNYLLDVLEPEDYTYSFVMRNSP